MEKKDNIYLRKDGRWEARYIKYYNKNKAIYGYIYGKSYNEAFLKRKNIISNSTLLDNNDFLFENIVDSFLLQKKLVIKESTYVRYYEIIRIYLLPYLKNINIKQISNSLIIDIYNNYYGVLSIKTKRDILILLNQILHFGGNNIKLIYPKLYSSKIAILDFNDIVKLEKYIQDNLNSFTLALLLSLYMGIRIGEICALRWNDINLVDNYIVINKTMNRIKSYDNNCIYKTKIVITTPKSTNSNRKIPIPVFLSKLLNDVKFNYTDEFFLTGSNKVMEPRVLRYKFSAICKELNISCKFHTLRHTFATRCIEEGFDPKTISELLGHSNVKTTLSLYVHPRDEYKIRCMSKLKPLSK